MLDADDVAQMRRCWVYIGCVKLNSTGKTPKFAQVSPQKSHVGDPSISLNAKWHQKDWSFKQRQLGQYMGSNSGQHISRSNATVV